MASEFQKLPYEMQWLLANGFNSKTQGNLPVTKWNTNDIDNEFSTKSKFERDSLVTAADNARKAYIATDEANQFMAKQWEPYGGLPGSKTGPSETWKYGYGATTPEGMKNPIAIQTPTNNAPGQGKIGGFYNNIPGLGKNSSRAGAEKAGLIMYYDMPTNYLSKTSPAGTPPNLSGGQASVPTVEQRMSRMGQAVQKGVNKGSMKASQIDRYRQQPSAPVSPTGNNYNQGYSSAPKPVPMPQGKSRGSYSPASRPQQAYNQSYPTAQLANYSAPKPVPLPQGKSRGS